MRFIQTFGNAGIIHQTGRNHAARAALRRRNGQMPRHQRAPCRLLHGAVARLGHVVNAVAQHAADSVHNRLNLPQRLRLVPAARGDAELAFAQGAIRRDSHAFAVFNPLRAFLCDLGFAHAVNADEPRRDAAARPGRQPVIDLPAEHIGHLVRRTGELNDDFTVLFDHAAGRGAACVGQNGAALGEHRLFAVIHRAGAPDFDEVFSDRLPALGVKHHRQAQQLGGNLLAQIILCRPKAARGDDQIASGKRQRQRFAHSLRVIAHHLMVIHRDAEALQFAREHLRVTVGDLPHQQLRADGHNFCNHLFSFRGTLGLCPKPHQEPKVLGFPTLFIASR